MLLGLGAGLAGWVRLGLASWAEASCWGWLGRQEGVLPGLSC